MAAGARIPNFCLRLLVPVTTPARRRFPRPGVGGNRNCRSSFPRHRLLLHASEGRDHCGSNLKINRSMMRTALLHTNLGPTLLTPMLTDEAIAEVTETSLAIDPRVGSGSSRPGPARVNRNGLTAMSEACAKNFARQPGTGIVPLPDGMNASSFPSSSECTRMKFRLGHNGFPPGRPRRGRFRPLRCESPVVQHPSASASSLPGGTKPIRTIRVPGRPSQPPVYKRPQCFDLSFQKTAMVGVFSMARVQQMGRGFMGAILC